MSLAIDVASWALLLGGGFFCILGALGLLRMPDFYTRVHAASLVDTLGAGLMLLGMMLQAGLTLVSVKLAMIFVLLLVISPTATHALANAAWLRGIHPLLGSEEERSSKP